MLWVKNLTTSLLGVMKRFVRDVGVKLEIIHTDFDTKLMAGEVEQFLIEEKIALRQPLPIANTKMVWSKEIGNL